MELFFFPELPSIYTSAVTLPRIRGGFASQYTYSNSYLPQHLKYLYWEPLLDLYNGMSMTPGRIRKIRSNGVPQYCVPMVLKLRESEWEQYRKNGSWSQRPPGEWGVTNLAGKCRLCKPSLCSCRFIKKAQISSSTFFLLCMPRVH